MKTANGAQCQACKKVFNGTSWNTSELSKHLTRSKDEQHRENKQRYEELKKQYELDQKMELEKAQKRAGTSFGLNAKKPRLLEDFDEDYQKMQESSQPSVKDLFSKL